MNDKELLKKKIAELKKNSGSHSPSVLTILEEIPQIKISVDACFLSNPYATDLFIKYLNNDLIKTGRIRDVLEFYPPQNQVIASNISKIIKIPKEKIFVGNGAIEIIQFIVQNFVKKKISVIIPTFSSYYEFVRQDTEVLFYKLHKKNNYELNLSDYKEYIIEKKPDSLVLINPNNPNGSYFSRKQLIDFLECTQFVENIILDESFIHFAYEDLNLKMINNNDLTDRFPNLIIVKSMSKDFGIAGLRAGYAIMNEKRVLSIIKNGFLWNVSGLADYFFRLYSKSEFLEAYSDVRKKYINDTKEFFVELSSIPNIKCLPSKANFVLVEILNGKSSFEFSTQLLVDHGVYVRNCEDKIGLEGQYIRVAARSKKENKKIIDAFKLISVNN